MLRKLEFGVPHELNKKGRLDNYASHMNTQKLEDLLYYLITECARWVLYKNVKHCRIGNGVEEKNVHPWWIGIKLFFTMTTLDLTIFKSLRETLRSQDNRSWSNHCTPWPCSIKFLLGLALGQSFESEGVVGQRCSKNRTYRLFFIQVIWFLEKNWFCLLLSFKLLLKTKCFT